MFPVAWTESSSETGPRAGSTVAVFVSLTSSTTPEFVSVATNPLWMFTEGFPLPPGQLLLLPVYLFLLLLLLIGIVLATSVLNVIYRDVAYMVNTGLTLLFWLTPVQLAARAV